MVGWVERSETHRTDMVGLAALDPPYQTISPSPHCFGYNVRMDSLTFLHGAAKAKHRPIYVLHGDESFLKRRVLAALRTLVLGADDHRAMSSH